MKTPQEILDTKEGFRGARHIFHYLVIKDAMEEYAAQWKPETPVLKQVWQYSTTQDPELWKDATNDEYYIGQHLAKYNWRQIEK